jgi:hypothetical protein
LADQMDFLLSHVPKSSLIRKRYTLGWEHV